MRDYLEREANMQKEIERLNISLAEAVQREEALKALLAKAVYKNDYHWLQPTWRCRTCDRSPVYHHMSEGCSFKEVAAPAGEPTR